MGACTSCNIESSEMRELMLQDRTINQRLKVEKRKHNDIFKVLLLGTGSSGKSTLMKQIKVLHTDQGLGDPLTYKMQISQNIISGILSCVQFSMNMGQDDTQVQKHSATIELYELLLKQRDADIWTEVVYKEVARPIHSVCSEIWEDPSTVDAYNDSESNVEIPVPYFMSRISEISATDYIPTKADILQIRQRTTGVVSQKIKFQDVQVMFIDVGGQRNERKKWISQFDDTICFLFLVSLPDFDKVLLEDKTTNRMQDAVKVFKDLVTCPYLEKTNCVLLFNKKDLMVRKIKKTSIKVAFPGYTGPEKDYRSAVNYIRDTFMNIFIESKQVFKDTEKPSVEVFNMVATDTKNVKYILKKCQDTIRNQGLSSVTGEVQSTCG